MKKGFWAKWFRFPNVPTDDDYVPILSYDNHQRLQEKRQMTNYPVGSRVIVRSNENEPYRLGRIERYEPITQAKNMTPIVKFDDTNTEGICMAKIRHYSEEVCKALDKLTPREQWITLNEWA